MDKQGKTLMTACEKMQVITRTESHVVANNLACHRADIHFKKRYGSFMRTQIVKKRQNIALISEPLLYPELLEVDSTVVVIDFYTL
jgi:hypothetical protein